MSFKNKVDASFEEIIRLVAKVISGTGADSLFGFRTEVTGSSIPDNQPVPMKPAESLRWIIATDTGNVAISSFDDVLVYASAGKIARVLLVQLVGEAVATATSGVHYLELMSPASDSNYFGITRGEQNYNAICSFNRMYWNSVSSAFPADAASQGASVRSIEFDDTIGLRVRYYNGTNAVQTADRTIRILVAERSVA